VAVALLGSAALAVVLAALLARATLRSRAVERLAATDPLTGLPNRRALDRRLGAELARADRTGAPLCVVFVDLDGFKTVNDRRGHRAGDALLVEMARRWSAALRPYDLLARHGGDEFVVVLPACGTDHAVVVVDRLRSLVPDGNGLSAGITGRRPGDDPEGVLERADDALRQAKSAGGFRTVVVG